MIHNIIKNTETYFENTAFSLIYDPNTLTYTYTIDDIKSWEYDYNHNVTDNKILAEIKQSPKRINRDTYIRLISDCLNVLPMEYFPSYNDFKNSKVKIIEKCVKNEIINIDYLNEDYEIQLKNYVYNLNDEIDLGEYAYFQSLELSQDKKEKILIGLSYNDMIL